MTGCTGLGGEDGSKGSPTGDGHREVEISRVDDIPADAPLEPSVSVLRSRVSTEQTARIYVFLKNVTDKPVWHNSVRIPAFGSSITDETARGQRLVLLPPDEQYATVSEQCWRADLTAQQLDNAYTDVVTNVRYDPGEGRATEFDIYGHPENEDSCLPPADFPIDDRYTITDEAEAEEASWLYNWGFRISVYES